MSRPLQMAVPLHARLRRSLSQGLPPPRTSISSGAGVTDDPKGPLGLIPLFSPPNPRIDLVFVHGLGGGSRKTWSKTPVRSHYWPKEWLSKDAAFQDVRIHSYGYDSDYMKGREDCLNIHHIGKGFLVALSTSESIAGSKTRIIVVGHSMGGLVIKKAYISATQDPAHRALADRFAAIFFLATPHRGSDYATLLKKILKVAFERAYIEDLERNSGAIQVINDQFRHVSGGLELWSFYETQNMRPFSSPIVDPESAVLGYPGENQVPMTADHRSICKFETQSDPNYILLRNSLALIVTSVTASPLGPEQNAEGGQAEVLAQYLGVSEDFENDLQTVCEARMDHSCEWILDRDDYNVWKNRENEKSRVLWVRGGPATGKSVLAGYVIEELRASNCPVSYFFFNHGDKTKTSLGTCFRTLAFQMASSIAEARKTILRMHHDRVHINSHDERGLWRALFSSGIFTTISRHYWVIDALDECSNPGFLSLAIAKLGGSVPLRILITSRDTAGLVQDFSGMPANILRDVRMSVADTLPDLKLLVESQSHALNVVGPDDRARLVDTIVNKSRGSFLWTILVLKELRSCYGTKEIEEVLQDIPRGMEPLYKRILDSMSQTARGKDLAKAILVWVTCAVRPMSTKELSGALGLDLHDTFPNLEESISALCGQLVVVDKLAQVQMVHETAREILVGKRLDSEFTIDETEAHTRMAKACVAYLVGDEMRPPRSHRRQPKCLDTKRLEFAAYACNAYSYHLSRSDPLSSELFLLVQRFLTTNVLSWIETVAENESLNQLLHTSKHLKTYTDACSATRSPSDLGVRNLRQWAADLARIPAVFGTALTQYPSAIYFLIPPFCPTDSGIGNTSIPGRRLRVQTASNKEWNDRLAYIAFRQGQAGSICYGEEFLAIGLSDGTVAMYYTTSYQEYRLLEHGEWVKFIAIRSRANLIATCGMTTVKVWDIRSGRLLHSLQSPPRPLGMEFNDNTLMVASDQNFLASWDIGRNALPNAPRSWADCSDIDQTLPRRAPCAIAISVSQAMLAIAYSGQPIVLWDLESDEYIGNCGKQMSSGGMSSHVVTALVINPNPSIGLLLAAAYLDGDLALLDASQLAPYASPFPDLQQHQKRQQVACFRAECHTLAASPSGRLLAAGNRDGVITVFDFETLRPLYRAGSPVASSIKHLAFAPNGGVSGGAGTSTVRLADMRAGQCIVWEPEALLGDGTVLSGGIDDPSGGRCGEGTGSDNGVHSAAIDRATIPGSRQQSLPIATGSTEAESFESRAKVTALAVCSRVVAGAQGFSGPADDVVFVGRDDGAVILYDAQTAAYLRTLYSHNSAVRLVACSSSRTTLLSVDASNKISLRAIRKGPGQAYSSLTLDELFDSQLESMNAVFGALLDDDGSRFVLSTRESDHLLTTSPEHTWTRTCEGIPDTRKWLRHPQSSHHMICVDSATVGIYQWDDFSQISSYSLLIGPSNVELKNAAFYKENNKERLILEFSEKSGSLRTSGLAIFDADEFDASPTLASGSNGERPSGSTVSAPVADNEGKQILSALRSIAPLDTRLALVTREIAHVIGLSDSGKLVFIDRSSWICSVDLTQHSDGLGQGDGRPINELFRHFFVPQDWFAGTRDIVCAMSPNDLILTRSGDLAIIKGPFEYAERVILESYSKR